MNILTFDTLKFAKRLEEAGFTERQAETLAEEQAAFAEDQAKAASENLATKTDLEALKAEILKWMFGGMLGQVAVLTALIKLL